MIYRHRALCTAAQLHPVACSLAPPLFLPAITSNMLSVAQNEQLHMVLVGEHWHKCLSKWSQAILTVLICWLVSLGVVCGNVKAVTNSISSMIWNMCNHMCRSSNHYMASSQTVCLCLAIGGAHTLCCAA